MYVEYSRAAADWVLKKHIVKDTVTYKRDIIEELLNTLGNGQQHDFNLSEYIIKPIPKNMYPIDKPKPSKNEVIAKQKSRFK